MHIHFIRWHDLKSDPCLPLSALLSFHFIAFLTVHFTASSDIMWYTMNEKHHMIIHGPGDLKLVITMEKQN